MKSKILISSMLLFTAGTFVFAGESPFVRKNQGSIFVQNKESQNTLSEEKINEIVESKLYDRLKEMEKTSSKTKAQNELSEEQINTIVENKLQKRLKEIEKTSSKANSQNELSEEEINAIVDREVQKRLTEIEKKMEAEKKAEKQGPAITPQPTFTEEQIKKIVDHRIDEKQKQQKAEEERNNGWYLSLSGNLALANDKIAGDSEFDMFGATLLLGKELDDSIWDIAGMVTFLTGEVDDEWHEYYNDYYYSYWSHGYVDYWQEDILIGLRVGVSFDPASWLTLKFGVMGGLDYRYAELTLDEWGSYGYGEHISDDDEAIGAYAGAYASVRLNFSNHWSLNVEGSYLYTSADLEEDWGIESSLSYTNVSAGLTYRW